MTTAAGLSSAIIETHASPNWEPRSGAGAIDMLILHYTGMATGEAALTRLCDPQAKVSAHYLIEEDGRVFRLVADDHRAWHAGVSCWQGDRDVNGRSIGIEIVNPGHDWGYRDFPEPQITALMALSSELMARHSIPAARVLGHSDVAPDRKIDPGERFPWKRLAAQGIGIWPGAAGSSAAGSSVIGSSAGGEIGPGDEGLEIATYQQDLALFGYDIDAVGVFDPWTGAVTGALQRHFLPDLIGGNGEGRADARTRAAARWLGAQAGRAERQAPP